MKKVFGRCSLSRFHQDERGEAADLLVKAALLCIVWYAGLGVYDWIQGVKQERIEQHKAVMQQDQRRY